MRERPTKTTWVRELQLGWELDGLKECVLRAYKSPPYNRYKRYAVDEINKVIMRFKSIEKIVH